MVELIKSILLENRIELCAPISLSSCRILRPYKLERAGFDDINLLSAIILAVPYLTRAEERNLSAYAAPRDYHGFFEGLFANILPSLRQKYPQYIFAGFADDSPIDERLAAASAGLGIIGDNGLLITERYSSYVFLGEIITNAPIEASANPIRRCEGCGACKRVCPMNDVGVCLSALTQKKGELSEAEAAAIKKYGSVWGCDKCQEVCPHTKDSVEGGTIYTDIPYFKDKLIPTLTEEILDGLSDADFAERAYSWRKRDTIKRNVEIINKK